MGDKLTIAVMTNEGTANPEVLTYGIAERILPHLAFNSTPKDKPRTVAFYLNESGLVAAIRLL